MLIKIFAHVLIACLVLFKLFHISVPASKNSMERWMDAAHLAHVLVEGKVNSTRALCKRFYLITSNWWWIRYSFIRIKKELWPVRKWIKHGCYFPARGNGNCAKGLINYICILAHASGKFDFLGNAKNDVAMVTIVPGITYEYQQWQIRLVLVSVITVFSNKMKRLCDIWLLLQVVRCHSALWLFYK